MSKVAKLTKQMNFVQETIADLENRLGETLSDTFARRDVENKLEYFNRELSRIGGQLRKAGNK